MDSTTISARFAAYTWYIEAARGKDVSRGEAARFVDANWRHFLGHAHDGLGRLLRRITRRRAPKRPRETQLAS
jgi:hypothetical protein